MSEVVFKKFLDFLEDHLEENKELISFVKKRYDECSDSFRFSKDFLELTADIQSKIEAEKHRIFVHLKNFLAELKSYRVTTAPNNKRKLVDDVCEGTNKKQCVYNSCSDLSSDSDFFKRNNTKQVNVDSSKKSEKIGREEKNEDSCGKEESISCEKDDQVSPIVEESLSNDSIQSDFKSSDSSDFPTYFSGEQNRKQKSPSVDLISLDSKSPCPASSSNHESASGVNKHTSSNTVLLDCKESSSLDVASDCALDSKAEDVDSDREKEAEESKQNCLDLVSPSPNTLEESASNLSETKEKKKKKGSERQIKRLEKLLDEIDKEIKAANEKELDLEEMETDDSAYLYEDRLQKKFVKVWEKLCELKNQDTKTGRPIERKFHYNGTRYTEVNKKIEKFINKKKIFPDYNDIKNIINHVNTEHKLYLGKTNVEDLAREAFTDVGNQLQERRHRDFILTFGNSQTEAYRVTTDPATYDKNLKKKLDENRKLAKSKLDDIISKYAQKQYDTNAQPEEVDENVLESSSEEEDEEDEIPELDEVMALDDDDEDDDITEIKTAKPSGSVSLQIPPTKDLKVQLEKLVIPTKVQNDINNISDSSASNSYSKTRSRQDRGCKMSAQSQKGKSSSQVLPLLPLHRVVKSDEKSKDASEKIVIDLDSSESEENGVSCSIPIDKVDTPTSTCKEQSLIPLRPRCAVGARNSNTSLSSSTTTSSSSSSGRMFVSSQSNMQLSMEVKTQVQQQQDFDGVSFKIASVASLAYSMNNRTSNSKYFTAQQTNYQSQNYQVTSGSSYGVRSGQKWPATTQSKEVIVLSDSD
ncbi:death domain-associated protein 6 [Octopus sinensis]|uniref:Death domain-associated protein 6 n=1 Tax=Octopus sinensis TaxID=2607531 RepID=A0A6P7U5W6_9MOLL|nr:death domain-associated protein 6 [Octopus sinensis]XP_029656882.1 death domain-associated protein 6 [Octopus sinensis]